MTAQTFSSSIRRNKSGGRDSECPARQRPTTLLLHRRFALVALPGFLVSARLGHAFCLHHDPLPASRALLAHRKALVIGAEGGAEGRGCRVGFQAVYTLGHLDHQTDGSGNITATFTYDNVSFG